MKLKQSALLNSVVADTAIQTDEAGFLPGMNVVAQIASEDGAFAGSAIVQTSDDGSTWGTAEGAVAVTGGGVSNQLIKLKKYVRLNVTARSAGNIQLSLFSDIC